MTEILIIEEPVTTNFIEDLVHPHRFDGGLPVVHRLSGEGHVEEGREFLMAFLTHQAVFPLYVHFVDEYELSEDFTTFFQQHQIDYTVDDCGGNLKSYGYKRYNYYSCITAKIQNIADLRLVLNKTYWLASENVFYCISHSDSLTFEWGDFLEWGVERRRSIAVFDFNASKTYITTDYDGLGLCILSRDTQYASLAGMIASLPDQMVVTQINDELIEDEMLHTEDQEKDI